MKTVSFRLRPKELSFVEKVSSNKEIEKSAAVRELIEQGWTYLILKAYKEGKISTGKAAKELNVSISEFIDILAELGIKSPITYEDYLEGEKFAKDLF